MEERLHSLARVVQLAEGRLPDDDVRTAGDLVKRAGRRLDLGLANTVVALAGATGSGKSSIFNAIAGRELSTVGVRRPTTGVAQACVWGESGSDELLEWLAIPRRHRMEGGDDGLEGLVLLDLPDHDSTEVAHRLEVDRLAGVVDLLIWVLDPQKYADAALHERYIKMMAPHESITMFVLNQSDRLGGDELDACIADLRRVLRADGLRDPHILPTSVITGDGMNVLKSEIATRVHERKAALDRLSADLEVTAERLGRFCTSADGRGANDSKERVRLVDALADAAGARVVSDAVARSHMRASRLATGWPVTRWLARVRPDPLRRMHLGAATEDATSVPDATPAQQAEVALRLNALSDKASQGLPRPWPSLMRSVTVDRQDHVYSELRRGVGATRLSSDRTPAWFTVVGWLQRLLILVAVAGALWLLLLWIIAWLKLPDPPTYEIERIPVPTALLIGGVLAGLLVAIVSRYLARIGANRRRRAILKTLRARADEVAERSILGPLEAELQVHDEFCNAVAEIKP